MILAGIILVIGIILLVYFSNLFVDSASSIATSFKVPKMVIGLTIASFCTCTPELAISFNSIMSGNYDITLANIIGSCVVNILLIIGLASIVKPIKIKNNTVRKELPLLLITTTGFALLFLDGIISKIDALILILFFLMFCIYLIREIKKFKKVDDEQPKYSKGLALLLTISSIIIITVASNFVVDATIILAHGFNVSVKIITMTIIVIGTSLPELTITVQSARKGEFDLTVGNIIGTNIFNICIVLALPILIFGSIYTNAFNYIDLFYVVIAALFFFILGKSGKTITRGEGLIMIITFILYYLYVFTS